MSKNYSTDKLVKDVKDSLDKQMGKLFEFENEILDMTKGDQMPQSKILTTPEQLNLLKKWLKKEYLNLKLLYRGSRDGFTGSSFHSRCNSKSETITLVKTQNTNKIFGGYFDKAWTTKEGWVVSSKVFLFSLTNKA